MKLFLVRHGQAYSENEDKEKRLTGKGNQDTQKSARFLKSTGIRVDRIISSRKKRAQETAEIFRKEFLPEKEVEYSDGLLPNDSAEGFLRQFKIENSNLMIIGHLPFLDHLASLLLTGNPNTLRIVFQPSTVVCLEQLNSGAWQLYFSLDPSLLKT